MDASRRQAEVDYQTIVETVPAIVFVADTGIDGVWHYVNDWIEPILGFTVDEWIGPEDMWARQLHPDDRARVLAAEAEEVAAAEESADDEDDDDTYRWSRGDLDYRMLHKDGHVVWIRDSSVLVRAPDGRLLWHGVMLDISDQKQGEERLGRQSAAQAAVARLGELALGGMPIAELLQEACHSAIAVLGNEAALASKISDDGQRLELQAEAGWETPEGLRSRDSADRESPTSYMLLTGKPLLVGDWEQETRFPRTDRVLEQGIRSSIGARIEGPAEPWGVLRVFSSQANVFTDHDVNFVVALANILADAIERQEAEDAMQHRALHDVLTGLPNRSLFADRLEQALERLRRHPGSLAAILFIDVDHFKQVNDSLGHQAGDELLMGVATRLREAVRPTDTVGRFGGDEFGLLLEEISSERVAIATAERIAAGFARPFALESGSQFVTVSIGIALADGHQDAEALLRDSDAAMYRAKQRGRARYDVFDDDLRMRALARGRTESELGRALEMHELRLVYQPVVDLRGECVSAVEALVRWDHPQRGELLPAEFIAVAEESGMIERIGQWVLDEAARDAAAWEQVRPDQPPIRVGINVSVQQLLSPRFPDSVSDAIRRAGIQPQTLSLELDESVLRDEADQIRSTLRLLKRVGVRLAVHDFGTGDSSLRQLAALPIDTIKVDRRFVSALGTADAAGPIAHAVIATGTALGLNVIGLGAESPEQVEQLRALGCDGAQGFLFSEPLPAAAVRALLAEGGALKRTLA